MLPPPAPAATAAAAAAGAAAASVSADPSGDGGNGAATEGGADFAPGAAPLEEAHPAVQEYLPGLGAAGMGEAPFDPNSHLPPLLQVVTKNLNKDGLYAEQSKHWSREKLNQTLVMTCPKTAVGSLIGKGGSMICDARAENGCKYQSCMVSKLRMIWKRR